MTLSLSASVRPCFPFFLLMSFKFLLVPECFNGVQRLFKGCLKFKGSFEDVSNKIEGFFN